MTYNPKLASKKRYEINRQVEKAKKLCYSQAKRSEYGDLGKYVNFTDENGEKAKATINEEMCIRDRYHTSRPPAEYFEKPSPRQLIN